MRISNYLRLKHRDFCHVHSFTVSFGSLKVFPFPVDVAADFWVYYLTFRKFQLDNFFQKQSISAMRLLQKSSDERWCVDRVLGHHKTIYYFHTHL
jgi:hypothetical protein